MEDNKKHTGHVHTSRGFGKGDVCCSAEDAEKITPNPKAKAKAKPKAKAKTNGDKK